MSNLSYATTSSYTSFSSLLIENEALVAQVQVFLADTPDQVSF